MTDRKLFSLVVVAFLVVATLSGGMTVAVLSDDAAVATVIGVGNSAAGNAPLAAGNVPVVGGGNVPVSVTANVDEPAVSPQSTGDTNTAGDSGTGSATTLSTTSTDSGGVSIALEPATRTVDAGGETTYEVVLTGATDGVSSYDLTIELSDSSVATFGNFTASGSGAVMQQSSGDAIDVSVGLEPPISGSEEIVLGSVTVTGTAAGQTELAIAREDDGSLEGSVTDGDPTDPTYYEVNVTNGGTLTVESE